MSDGKGVQFVGCSDGLKTRVDLRIVCFVVLDFRSWCFVVLDEHLYEGLLSEGSVK